jgi:hypothetical protein
MAMAWLSTACWTCRHAAHLGTIGIVLSEHEGVLPRGRELIVRSCLITIARLTAISGLVHD